MQEPNTGEMFDAEAVKERFGKEAENLQQTAARLGFPVWTSDEILTIKGKRLS